MDVGFDGAVLDDVTHVEQANAGPAALVETRTSRRSLLRTGAAAAAGLVALEAGARQRAPTLSFPPGPATLALSLSGRDVVASVVGRPTGAVPAFGDQVVTVGDLYAGDEKVGEFYATSLHLRRGGFNPQQLAASAEQHTFHLEEGTILGAGTASHLDGADAFAVTGGTGRFARASGTYQGLVSAHRLGGDGTATFLFDLTLEADRGAR